MTHTSEHAQAHKMDWLVCVGLIALFMLAYGAVNHLPLDRRTIGLAPHENSIPFWPWTLVVYLSIFVQAGIVLRHAHRQYVTSFLKLSGFILGIGLIMFVLWPLEYPRALYPSSNGFVTSLRSADGAGNCFPSLHVAMATFLASFYLLTKRSRLKKVLMTLWTVAIVISVLTTKQHYAIDILGGVLLAAPFILLLRKRIQKG